MSGDGETTTPDAVRDPRFRLGFGTFRLEGAAGRAAFEVALETGYRHFDTAAAYGNEADLGETLASSGLERGDLLITTKIPRRVVGAERAWAHQSLQALRVDHVDLLLLHWPADEPSAWLPQWEVLLELRQTGIATSVGVSNHTIAQLDTLAAGIGESPAVNQIKYSPALHDPALLDAHAVRGVVVQGYMPLRSIDLTSETVARVAEHVAATPAQAVIAWHIAHGVATLVRSARPQHITDNWAAADLRLTADDVAALDALATPAG